jgi:hypothetical protein
MFHFSGFHSDFFRFAERVSSLMSSICEWTTNGENDFLFQINSKKIDPKTKTQEFFRHGYLILQLSQLGWKQNITQLIITFKAQHPEVENFPYFSIV